jgi:tetratricopeptide (TPR) repeat protein
VAEVFEHNLKDLQGLAALAAHMLRLLAEEPGSREDPSELFGISRLLQRRGDTDGAFASYQRALSEGLEGPAQQSARRELALLSRRRRNFPAARDQWAMLLDDSRGGMEAYQQLAIYHEHHAGDPEEAARITREALVRLQGCYQAGKISPHQYRRLHEDFHHRLARLSRKGGV